MERWRPIAYDAPDLPDEWKFKIEGQEESSSEPPLYAGIYAEDEEERIRKKKEKELRKKDKYIEEVYPNFYGLSEKDKKEFRKWWHSEGDSTKNINNQNILDIIYRV